MKMTIGIMTTVAVCAALGGCSPTRHRPTYGPGGQENVRIHCRTRTPHKCTRRARDVCGTYTIIEPLHLDPQGEVESTMIVHCDPPPEVPPASAVIPNAAGSSMNAQPAAPAASAGTRGEPPSNR